MKKKILSIIVTLVTIIALLPYVATPASAGTADVWDGTADTSWYTSAPADAIIYEIDTAEELAGLAKLVNDSAKSFFNKTIMLKADIDLNNLYWTPIGGQSSAKIPFTGEFNGNGHTISNLNIDGSKLTSAYSYNKPKMGLFGHVGNGSNGQGAYIHDFTIKTAQIKNPKDSTGVVAGYLGHDVVMENIVVEDVTITGIGSAISGVVWSSQLRNIVARNVTVNAPSGGEVGGLFTFVQSYSYPYSTIPTVSSFTAKNDPDPTKTIKNYCLPGTIISDATPENSANNPVFVCYFENVHGENITINVTNSNSYVGGFVAYNLDYPGDTMFCKDCSVTGLEINILSGSALAGGFVGLCATTMNYEYTDLEGNLVTVGGFENCSIEGEINGKSGTYGGFVAQSRLYRYPSSGRPGFNAVTDRSYDNATTNVDIVASANATVGGFAGEVNTVKSVYNTNAYSQQTFSGCEVLGTTKLGNAEPLGSGFIGKSVTNSTKGIVIEDCTVSGIEDIDEYLEKELLTNNTATEADVIKKILLGNGAASANFAASGAIVFDTDGGTAIPSVEGALGTAVTVPANPTKDGYTFIGWDKEIPTTIPGSVITVKALWEANDYTITFDTDGGSAIAPITQAFGSSVTAPADPTKDGYTFKGWDKEIPSTMPIDGLTVKALWEANDYTITFDTDGGSAIAPITQAFGSSITAPADPTKDGYTFKGWDKEIPTTMPVDGLTVKALWEANDYTITFDTDGGSAIAPITQAFGSSITVPADPTKDGYTFKGWDKEIPSTMPINGLTVKALWEVNDYTITFDTDGGSAIAPITQAFGSSITAPADPTKDGYTFKGWDKEIPSTMPIDGLTVKALWEANNYTITFDTDGGSAIAHITQAFGSNITAPADPTKDGYTFKGWDKEIPSTMPIDGLTVKALWEANDYTITFDTDGGSAIAPITQAFGSSITAPADPTKDGYTFKGWDKEIPTTTPIDGLTVKALWEANDYTITFDTDGGSAIAPITQAFGSSVTAPADPTKDGYTFKGWDKEIPTTMPIDGLTVKALWEVNSYTITFNANGGSDVAPITQDFGTAVTQPADPTLEDYIFDGWYADEELTLAYEFTTMPAGDITIYAKWKPVPVKVPTTGDNAYPLLWIIGVALSIIAIAVVLFTSKKKCVR